MFRTLRFWQNEAKFSNLFKWGGSVNCDGRITTSAAPPAELSLYNCEVLATVALNGLYRRQTMLRDLAGQAEGRINDMLIRSDLAALLMLAFVAVAIIGHPL